ncbi:unnamed protein product [Vitrella brassicaformis CCMP3155]|uniref:Uncharacterized protein n=1 Tax=Vitrella brassicaformis (strain CCMP3155) TaxID=1169540 RepID=A0A0G4EEG7_VITBC|nr:unnamed protein product [Vitrella brassicaformis CCMP3155]|eukprot:CEL93952.1 unnamed protein product [Vitrella brassicaformis CCMP3155]
MSDGHDSHMASAAMADEDVAEEEHSGRGQAEESDCNGSDSGGQQQQEGAMANEMADGDDGPQAADGDESDGMQDEDGDGDQDDDIDDGYFDDDYIEYEEEGHPLSGLADPTVPVPDGHIGLDELEAWFLKGTNDATKELSRDSSGAVYSYPPLCLAIDNKSDCTVRTIQAENDFAVPRPVALPHWSSDELQSAVLSALLNGGADPNVAADETEQTPLQVAIASGNQKAFDILRARQGIDLYAADAHMVMKLPRPLRLPPPEYLQRLMSMYERLARRDPTLATEHDNGAFNLVHWAAINSKGRHPPSFINAYLDLITANGADITAGDAGGQTPLHKAAFIGSPHVADYLCRKLPADQINRQDNQGQTPLAWAAGWLDRRIRHLQDPNTPEHFKEKYRADIDNFKLTIRSLLRAGADISSIPTATERDRCGRQVVLTEYATVLNKVGPPVMVAVNAALAPHRSLAALLTPRLAVGPQEAPIFGWRIASYLFDMDAAQEAISEAIGVRHSDMARRLCAAAEHFVRSVVYQASSNREVVGGTADVGGQVVRVPQLQCFELKGIDSRPREAVHTRGRVGLREVVHRARMDEAAKWGLADGAVVKGFNTHLGDADCQFTWQQLGAALHQPTPAPAPAATQQPTPAHSSG